MTMKTIKVKLSSQVPKNFTGIVKFCYGTMAWYKNGQRHREDAPAVECSDGTKFWYQNGRRHRINGPSHEYSNGEREYWILDEKLTKEQFEAFQIMWKQTLLERTEELMDTFVELAKMK